jgi:transposase
VSGHRQYGLDAKKKTVRAAEQDEAKRAAWRDEIAEIDPRDLVFVDETGVTIAMARRFARAPSGQRAVGKIPRNHGTRTTLVADLSMEGLGEAMTIPGAMDTIAFETYVEELLCPSLRSGQVVVIDNLSVHKSGRTRELIEAAGCCLLFLPPYSPDFSPIELAFSKIKEFLRAAAARTQEALDEAISKAMDIIMISDALGYFKHCGYQPL